MNETAMYAQLRLMIFRHLHIIRRPANPLQTARNRPEKHSMHKPPCNAPDSGVVRK